MPKTPPPCEDCRRAARVRAAARQFPQGGYNPTEECSIPEHRRSKARRAQGPRATLGQERVNAQRRPRG